MRIEGLATKTVAHIQQDSAVRSAQSFGQVKAELSRPATGSAVFGPELHGEIQQLTQRVLSGVTVSPQELLLYQVKVGQYSLRVELISKVAESLVSTFKKLQNPQ